MENENNVEVKKNNNSQKVIIILLVVIILLLGAFITLILTGVINFDKKPSNVENVITSNDIEEDTVKKMVIITGDGVRIRNNSTTKGSNVMGIAKKNEQFELIDENTGSSGNGCSKDWYKINYLNKEGYVCSEFASIVETTSNCKDKGSYNYIKDDEAVKIINGFYTEKISSQSIIQYLDWGRNYSFCDFDYDTEVYGKNIGLTGENADNWYAVCKNYKNYKELESYLNKYVTYNFMKKNWFISNPLEDAGEKIYFYYEYGNKLYSVTPHKGGYSLKETPSKNKYNIISHTKDKITAMVNRYYNLMDDVGESSEESEERYIVLINEKGTWKLETHMYICE